MVLSGEGVWIHFYQPRPPRPRRIGPRMTGETDAESASGQQEFQKFPAKYPALTSLVIVTVSQSLPFVTASRIWVPFIF